MGDDPEVALVRAWQAPPGREEDWQALHDVAQAAFGSAAAAELMVACTAAAAFAALTSCPADYPEMPWMVGRLLALRNACAVGLDDA